MKFCLTQLLIEVCKMFANWEEVFESFAEIEKDKIRADVENCYVNEHWVYSSENFLWALSQKARVLRLKILLLKMCLQEKSKHILFSDSGEGRFIDFDRNVIFTTKDAFLIDTTLYIYYNRTISAEVINVIAVCTLTDKYLIYFIFLG